MNDVGLTAEFECEISKDGLKGEWFKKDKAVKTSDKYEMIDKGTVHKLIIKDAGDEDQSQYTVVFKKEAKTTAKLTVNGKHTFRRRALFLGPHYR